MTRPNNYLQTPIKKVTDFKGISVTFIFIQMNFIRKYGR